MKKKIHDIKKENFTVLLIHQLTNDVEKFCHSEWSNNNKKKALIFLAEKYVIIIKKIAKGISRSTNIYLLGDEKI